ncbi:unnamed protein product [Ectocarpus sp. 12 AP-2014]
MALDDQPGERQPVQRRVSYRRLKGEDNSEGNTGNGGGISNLDSRSGPDGSSLPKVAAESLGVALRGGSGYDRGTREGYDLDGRDADATDAPTAVSNPYGSLSTTTPKSIWHEIWLAARDGVGYILLTTLLGAAVSLVAVVHLTSHESGAGASDTPRLPARRIPPADEQAFLHDSRMRGATTINIGEGSRGSHRHVVLQGATAAPKEGHLRLPDQFYQGVHFGVSAWDIWGEKLTDAENRRRNGALRQMLEGQDPQPTGIYPTMFEGGVEGFTVAFLAGSLGRQEMRSVRERSDPAWAEAETSVLAAARHFQQLTVTKWHPKVWGPGHERDENLHTSVLQEVLPTRTGLRALASTVVVYRVETAVPLPATTTPEDTAKTAATTTKVSVTAARAERKARKTDAEASRPGK